MTAKIVQETLSNMFHIKGTYLKAWQWLTKAFGMKYGDWNTSYAELPKYLKVVKQQLEQYVIHTRSVFD